MKTKILNKTWTIKESTTQEIGDVMISTSRYYAGACDYMTKTIHILKDLDPQIKRETLTHELGHAIMHEASLNEHLNDKQKEQYCEFLKFAYPIVHDVITQTINKKL